ncbi:cell division protein ZapA [Oharaeibacter diazotrophicus]|uniref:Cell division protein ZapA n=1 Tax=Oharaeibacter diazotrophicus TaxID=1920512 RepID=A0A4R6RHG9_9HYPH|nr:cell division protein ZapA [Oharaeibacter diazotrophicus]TDP85106.1 cell division protein ZapA [Oharaeibacter diazotrophicus]BBE74076.1 cell division protein ZapA [Pleomorphomonas sp. SM30]GLS76236.1 cell division protein ZapA [Oharaeibacter diazotrophicus]
MAQVTVTIAGKTYRMACDDGQEEHLLGLAGRLDGMLDDLKGVFGEIGDQRLTVMSAITVLDQLAEAENRIAALEADLRALDDANRHLAERHGEAERAVAGRLSAAAGRIEALAARLDEAVRPA